jgi:hypothetical protein
LDANARLLHCLRSCARPQSFHSSISLRSRLLLAVQVSVHVS